MRVLKRFGRGAAPVRLIAAGRVGDRAALGRLLDEAAAAAKRPA